MKARNPVPATPASWLREIAAAFRDARETIVFGPLVGEPFGDAQLFHLAPATTLKFRGIRSSARALSKATDAALSSYVANGGIHQKLLQQPHVAFALCYVASHYGLDLLQDVEGDRLMTYV